jgi:HemY protein
VLKLLPELRRQNVLPAADLAELEVRATINLLDDAAARGQLEAVRNCWRELPKAVTRDARAVASYARALMLVGAGDEAERVVRTQLKREWTRELIGTYGKIPSTDGTQQLKTAEQWLGQHGRDAILLLTLGRLSIRNQLWGKAREYFETSLKLEENPETCAELGRLLAQLGQHERSAAYYERGLAIATKNNLPALPSTRSLIT